MLEIGRDAANFKHIWSQDGNYECDFKKGQSRRKEKISNSQLKGSHQLSDNFQRAGVIGGNLDRPKDGGAPPTEAQRHGEDSSKNQQKD